MPHKTKRPPEDCFLGRHEPTGAELFAYLADCPLYAHARVLCDVGALADNRRQSYWLGFVIEEQRFADNRDLYELPEDFRAWAVRLVREAYPSLAEATGLTPAEVQEIKREQRIKRLKYAR